MNRSKRQYLAGPIIGAVAKAGPAPAFFFLALLAAACAPEAPSAGSEKGDEPVIVTSGSESQTPFHPKAGQPPVALILGGTFSVALGLAPEQAYAALLQQRLAEARAPLVALNASIAGETAAGALERLPYLLAHPLGRLILETGQADEARGTGPEAFSRDVRKILRQARARYPEAPVLLLPSTRNAAYLSALATVSAEVDGVKLVHFLTEAGEDIRSDDAALHRRLAGRLWPLVDERK